MIRTWVDVEDDGSTGMNNWLIVVVMKAKLSSGSNRKTGSTKALINSVSANRLILRSVISSVPSHIRTDVPWPS